MKVFIVESYYYDYGSDGGSHPAIVKVFQNQTAANDFAKDYHEKHKNDYLYDCVEITEHEVE